jgi:hypothetical protein
VDVQNGDFLTVSGTDYPIKSVAEWSHGFAGGGFSKMASLACSTKRNPSISDGKRSTPTTNVSGLSCTPLDPVDPELQERIGIETPHTLLQTFVDDGTDYVRLVIEDKVTT